MKWSEVYPKCSVINIWDGLVLSLGGLVRWPCEIVLWDGLLWWSCEMVLCGGLVRWSCEMALWDGLVRWSCEMVSWDGLVSWWSFEMVLSSPFFQSLKCRPALAFHHPHCLSSFSWNLESYHCKLNLDTHVFISCLLSGILSLQMKLSTFTLILHLLVISCLKKWLHTHTSHQNLEQLSKIAREFQKRAVSAFDWIDRLAPLSQSAQSALNISKSLHLNVSHFLLQSMIASHQNPEQCCKINDCTLVSKETTLSIWSRLNWPVCA